MVGTRALKCGAYLGALLCGAVLLSPATTFGDPAPDTSGQALPASAALVPEHATLVIPAPSGEGRGFLHVTLTGAEPGNVTLRAAPLVVGDSYAFVRFPASGADLIRLDDAALKCEAGKECMVQYEVYNAWATGAYQGTIDAYTPQAKIGTTPISALRSVPAFRPVITGDAMHDGRIVFDATKDSKFLLAVQNPAGSPPHNISLSAEPACANGSLPSVSFAPSAFHLEPGATQTVIGTVQCLAGNTDFAIMKTINGDETNVWTETVISLSKFASTTSRQLLLLAFVIVGSGVSVLLNNIFPVNRAKNEMRNDLRRAQESLRDTPHTGSALFGSLEAEAARLRLSLQRIHFYEVTKLTATQEAQRGVAAFVCAAALAQRISLMWSKLDAATMSIAAHALIRGKVRDAEEFLSTGDTSAASDRLNEAQAKLAAEIADSGQKALCESLKEGLSRLMHERGVEVDPAADVAQTSASTVVAADHAGQVAQQVAQPEAPTVVASEDRASQVARADTSAGGAARAPAKPMLKQPQNRHPRIKAIIERLWQAPPNLDDATQRLEVESALYLADVWTKYVEPKLDAFQDKGLDSRRAALVNLSNSLLDCMLHNPKSDNVQVLLDLLRSDLTPDEIAAALDEGAQIDCDLRPKYFESVRVAFVGSNPLFNDVSAAKRLLTYCWSIDDNSGKPPDVDSFQHYFRPQSWWKARSYKIGLVVRVPFTKHDPVSLTSPLIVPRDKTDGWWKVEPMELASFGVTTAIAIVTAFGAHYAGSLPNEITPSDWLSSFMLGFGLDQLRDTVSPSAATTPAPTVQPAATGAAAPQK